MDEVARLRGELRGTQAAVALLMALLSGASKTPRLALESLVRKLEAETPIILASLEAGGAPEIAAGYERGIEALAALARAIMIGAPEDGVNDDEPQ